MKRLLLLALTLPVWAAPVLHTDARSLERDFRWPALMRTVSPAIVENAPWQEVEPGMRRRVFFNDRMTLVQLELDRDPAPSMQTHYHVHDQLTLLLEGRARVQVGDEVREVGPGAVYVAPSNVRHGLQPLTRRLVLVECFTPTREDFRGGAQDVGPPSANELKSFVYRWFALFDRNAPVEEFLQYLSPDALMMTFPERRLQSPAEFRAWYEQVRRDFPQASHEVEELRSSGSSVDLVVRWRASGPGGTVDRRFRQHWEVGPGPTLVSYQVTPL